MNPRPIWRAWTLAAALTLSPSLLWGQPGAAPPPSPPASTVPAVEYVVKNRDFRILAHPQRASAHQVEVLVFFWYGSPWAAKVEPQLRSWVESGAAPARVRVQYVPVALSNPWGFSARVFYALSRLGVERQLTPRLLQAVNERVVDLGSPVSMSRWLSQQGVSPDAFQKAINDPLVVAQVASLPAIARAYEIRSTPTFIIDGRYHIAATEKMPPERAAAVAMFMAQKLSEGGPRP